jgi:hypothetical protein
VRGEEVDMWNFYPFRNKGAETNSFLHGPKAEYWPHFTIDGTNPVIRKGDVITVEFHCSIGPRDHRTTSLTKVQYFFQHTYEVFNNKHVTYLKDTKFNHDYGTGTGPTFELIQKVIFGDSGEEQIRLDKGVAHDFGEAFSLHLCHKKDPLYREVLKEVYASNRKGYINDPKNLIYILSESRKECDFIDRDKEYREDKSKLAQTIVGDVSERLIKTLEAAGRLPQMDRTHTKTERHPATEGTHTMSGGGLPQMGGQGTRTEGSSQEEGAGRERLPHTNNDSNPHSTPHGNKMEIEVKLPHQKGKKK